MNTAAARAIEPPSAFLALTELPRTIGDISAFALAAPILAAAPSGDGHAVLVIPGFTAGDMSTTILRHYLESLGYDSRTWDLGPNLGPKATGRNGAKLVDRLKTIYDETGAKVSVVGWSLGGVMARQIARTAPHLVRQVITLGSPFTGDPRASTVWRSYQFLSGQRLSDPSVRRQLRESRLAPPVPSTAIYTRDDGVVAWQNCIEPASAETDNIEVRGSHCGLGVNPAVLYAVADRLAQKADDWRPFERSGLRAWVYPASADEVAS
ncbi:alpha/beta hydrolase [Sphingomonas sp. 3P27F8]|uniref:esterase/lipase family protein n=1 Tax=Sphingomonas sp. 3P27F8 TaxID=2502213 RepID=UPI0010F93F76|nr:alpha/beta hydrolase [Sphingomonas sp. 3P27F8]